MFIVANGQIERRNGEIPKRWRVGVRGGGGEINGMTGLKIPQIKWWNKVARK